MADNTTRAVTSGGDTIRDIDRAGVKTQVAALDIGGSAAERFPGSRALDGGSLYGLASDPRPNLQRFTQTSTGLTTSVTSYTAGDQLGALITFASAVRATAGVGRIVGAALKDNAKVIGGVDLRLFRASVTPASDNAAESFSDGDMDSWVGTIQMPFADTLALNSVSYAGSLNVPFDCAATSLFVSMVTRSNHSFFGAATDLRLTLFIVLD